jgi:hypothetical protein
MSKGNQEKLRTSINTPAVASKSRLPTFLIIGAMKAGTTSLYHYLRAHPEVYMPPFKAPEFFAGDSHWRRGIEWYARQFDGADPGAIAIGEASNVYTKYPRYQGVPQRIAEYIPDARLIYVLRDPIARVRSHFQTRVAEGTEKLPFDVAVFENPIYLDYSRYCLQIEQYLEFFPREQLLLLTAENLRNARAQTVCTAYAFLGVDDSFVPAELDRDFYETKDRAARSPVPVWIRKGLKQRFPAAKRFKELENNTLRTLNRLRRRADGGSSPMRSDPITDEIRARLAEVLADDVRQLRQYLGAEFGGWGIA